MTEWFAIGWSDVGGVVLSALGIYAALLIATRLLGLRSFSKISSFDFAITVALGSLIAATLLTPSPPLVQGAIGLATLFAIQAAVSFARRRWEWAEDLVDNRPLLLMARGEVIQEHLSKALVTEDDLRSKLRMAGITHPSQVFAVVMETTGDVAVIEESDEIDLALFRGVEGSERLRD
jgi:uncharacterized membrane protein YcaP (DUF421 family)